MGVEEFFKQEEERFIRDNLMSDEVLDFIRENTLPFNQLMAYYRCAIMEVETKFKVLNEQFSLQYDRNPIESIKTRIKSTEGIIKKANRKKIPFTMQAIEENIRDIAGIRVICSFSEDIYMLADCLLKQDDIRLVEMKDYIKHPKESGYRSLHVIIEIPIFLQNEKRYMKVEVQLRTIAMDFWASVEHKLRYKKNIPDSEAETLAVELSSYADQLAELDNKMEQIKKQELEELEKISKYSKEQAKTEIMKIVEEKMSKEITAYIKEKEAEAKLEVDEKSKELLVGTMQKYSADITSEQTVSVIALPNDEMKGRLIGREGRNIRTIESVTGVDLIIDDTPEAIVISSFDPLRREIARLTLETLIKDGRIHPARIEELYAKTCADVRTAIKEYGKNALYKLGLSKMDPELVEIVGKLHFRSSYGQNALKHSMEVANLSGILAGELGENVNLAKRAGLLHDIGKAIDFEMEGSHVKIGADLAKKYGEDEVVINSIASHHGDVPPTSIIASIVSIADSISASRPGARNDSSENYIQRLEELEAIGNDVSGVEKAYAVQAGRELRVMVKPEEVDDLTAYQIAREIKEKIENELKYPGTIKVTVIRETRCTEEAK